MSPPSPPTIDAPADWEALPLEDFRLRVRTWIEAWCPDEVRYPAGRLRWAQSREWWSRLYRRGWIAPGWPREHGGMGLSPIRQIVMLEELERHGCGRMPDQGITQVGPILLRYGTEAQRSEYLPKTLSGEAIWCQGYSEPNAGSDLASLQTSARLQGDRFVVDGSKIWTTLAMDATHMYLLARTSRGARKQQGISFLLVDMSTPGITVRPIRNIAGDEEFCQVFFDSVEIPRGNLVGRIDEGWSIAKSLLGFERLGIGSPRRPRQAFARLEQVARARGLFGDPAFLDRYTELRMDLEDLSAAYEEFVDQVRRGEPLGADVSLLKIWGTELMQRISELALLAAEDHAALAGEVALEGSSVNVLAPFYSSRPGTIYGGSNEIQRNILATTVLGLPR
ncbi:MAG: acyl-CoA dehydrogenase family protein [Pseudomonadota bacterium]